jgi:hypothetical protein
LDAKGKELKVNAMASFEEKKINMEKNQATTAWCKGQDTCIP